MTLQMNVPGVGGRGNIGCRPWISGIRTVNDAESVRKHMADDRMALVDHDLHAIRTAPLIGIADQLHVVGDQINVEVYSDKGNSDPVAIAQAGIAHAKANGHNVVIIDTAGRLAVDEAMMTEISNIHKAITPQETLFKYSVRQLAVLQLRV